MEVPFIVKKSSLNHNFINKNKNKNLVDPISLSVHSIYNLQDNSSRDMIRKQLKSVIGVYGIVHNDTQKMYIGSSTNLALRLYQHINNLNSNIYLQNAIAKYGLNNFYIVILEILPEDLKINPANTMADLVKIEQNYLDLFVNKYNINPTAGKTRLGSKVSETTKKLMSNIKLPNPIPFKGHSAGYIEELRKRMTGSGNPMYGKTHAEKAKKFLSELARSRIGPLNPSFGNPVTEANKKLISKLFSKPVFLYEAGIINLISKYDKQKDLGTKYVFSVYSLL